MGQIELAIGRVFARFLASDLGSDTMAEIRQRNATTAYAGACASHDFCDANEVMLEAFEAVMGRGCRFDESDVAILNAAWEAADLRGAAAVSAAASDAGEVLRRIQA